MLILEGLSEYRQVVGDIIVAKLNQEKNNKSVNTMY